jgi:hypothetical protein
VEENKKKSNLELFKEELKRSVRITLWNLIRYLTTKYNSYIIFRLQLDRDERHKKKQLLKSQEEFDDQNPTGIDKSDMDLTGEFQFLRFSLKCDLNS